MVDSFEIAQKLADANNSGDQELVFKLISETDFTDDHFLAGVAITVLPMSKENAVQYRSILIDFFEKYHGLFSSKQMDFKERMRFGFWAAFFEEETGYKFKFGESCSE